MASSKSAHKSAAKRKPAAKAKEKKKKLAAVPPNGVQAKAAKPLPAPAKDAKEKLKKGAKEKGGADELDPEEQAEELAAAVEVDPDAEDDAPEDEALAERKEVKDL